MLTHFFLYQLFIEISKQIHNNYFRDYKVDN